MNRPDITAEPTRLVSIVLAMNKMIVLRIKKIQASPVDAQPEIAFAVHVNSPHSISAYTCGVILIMLVSDELVPGWIKHI